MEKKWQGGGWVSRGWGGGSDESGEVEWNGWEGEGWWGGGAGEGVGGPVGSVVQWEVAGEKVAGEEDG